MEGGQVREVERVTAKSGGFCRVGIISEAHLTVCGHLVRSYVSDAIRRTSKSDWKPQKIIGIHRSWQGSLQIRPLGGSRLSDRAPPSQLNHVISCTAPGTSICKRLDRRFFTFLYFVRYSLHTV